MPLYTFMSKCIGSGRNVSEHLELSRIVLKVTYIKIVLKVVDISHEKRYINSIKSNER